MLALALLAIAARPLTTASLGVIWHAPFFSGGGYCSEATAFVLQLSKRIPVRIVQHGDGYNQQYMAGVAESTFRQLQDLYAASAVRPEDGVAICHSEPGAWHPPGQQPSSWERVACPPPGARYAVGRTMFETDRLPDGWAPRLNAMDEVWVPSQHSFEVFAAGGVSKDKLHVVGEPVDTDFFSPGKPGRSPFELPPPEGVPEVRHRFLSIFKWEARKAWDILLSAFFAEFQRSEGIVLYLLTNPYHNTQGLSSAQDFQQEVARFAQKLGRDVADLPAVEVLETRVPEERLPALYEAMDGFVLPSRGEGWGRPHVEAMSMGLPIAATNWSGPTEYATEDNSYPIKLDDTGTGEGGGDGLVEIADGPFQGHRWAAPSVESLRQQLRAMVMDPAKGKMKGARARQDMLEKFTPSVLASTIESHLRRIETHLIAGDNVGTTTDKVDL